MVRDPQGMADHRRPKVLRRPGIHQRRERRTRYQLVTHLGAVPVELVRVDHLPTALGVPVEIAGTAGLGRDRGGPGDQSQAVGVVLRHRWCDRVDLDDRVRRPVDVEIQSCHQEMLVERRVSAVVDDGAIRWRRLALRVRGRDHDPGRTHLALDVAVLVEPPVDEVLVVRDGHVAGDNHSPLAAHLGAGHQIDVLPEHRVVFFVQTDGVLDLVRRTCGVVQHRVDVADLAEAVAPQFQRGGHETEPPLADVESGTAVMIERGVAVGDHHLGQRHPVGDVTPHAVIIIGDLIDHRTLAIVEAQAHRPVLPTQFGALDGERRAVGLGDVQRLEIGALLTRPRSRHVFAVHRRHSDVELILDLEEFEGVHVDDELQSGNGVGVGVPVG